MSATTTRPVDDPRSRYGSAPERSLAQRFAALERANDIRSRRSELKRDLKAGRELIVPLVGDTPDYLVTAKVFDILLAVPKYGRVRVNKTLDQCKISPGKTLGGLSIRQRRDLILALHGRPPRPRPSVLDSREAWR